MRKNRYPVIDGDGHITERSKEILNIWEETIAAPAKTKLGPILFAFSIPRWLGSTVEPELTGLARLS
jgi:hypothetical protein